MSVSSIRSRISAVRGKASWNLIGTAVSVSALASAGVLALERAAPVLGAEGVGRLDPVALATLWGGFAHTQVALLALAALVVAVATVSGRIWPAAMLAAALTVAPMYWVGRALASGAWISEQPFAPLVRWGPVGAGVLGMAALVWVLMKFGVSTDRRTWRRRSLTIVLGVGALVVAIADTVVMPGLHQEFHLLLHCLVSLLAFLAIWRLLHPLLGSRSRAAVLAVGVSSLAVIVTTGSLWLTMSETVRAELVMRSPVAANLIRNIYGAAPGADLREVLESLDVDEGKIAAAPGRAESRLRLGDDWNIMLVSVDALRADALPPVRRPGQRHAVEADTPFLNEWLPRTLCFSHAYAQSTMTHLSLPPTFRSLEVFENPERLGVPLAVAMASLGRTPVAVVNNFFLEPRFKRAQQLLEGFEHVEVYEKVTMDTMVGQAADLLEKLGSRPFFAWLHFYNLHHPGFDGKYLGSDRSPWPVNYQRSLRWLDQEMRRLIEEIERIGIADRTVIVLVADHGEGLGDNGVQTHGPNVYEEEVRVPMCFFIPGREGRRIDATVGAIDLVPTFVELFGGEPNPQHRGTSLVPLLLDPEAPWERYYYLRNANAQKVGIVRGKDKLIYDLKAGVRLRFDVDADPTEEENLYDPDGFVDQMLTRQLMQRDPKPFSDDLADDEIQQLVLARLEEVDADDPGAALEFLLKLVALEPRKATLREGERLFAKTDSEVVRLLVLHHLFAADRKRLARMLSKHVEELAGEPAELELVRQLSLQGQGQFGHKLVAKRMGWWVRQGDVKAALPWLRLALPWRRKPAKVYGPTLVEVLEAGQAGSDGPTRNADVLEAALDVTASLGQSSRQSPTTKELIHASRPLVGCGEASVERAAVEALARLRDEGSVKPLQEKLLDHGADVRVRQAALHGLARIQGETAVAAISEAGKDLLLTVDAIKAIKDIGSPEGVPFLEWVEENHYNRLIIDRARKAKAAIAKKSGRKKPSKKE